MRTRRAHLGGPHLGGGRAIGYGDPNDGQDYVDRSVVPFDPAAGLLCGTAVGGVIDDSPAETPTHATIAQRAADRDAATATVGPFAVRRHPTPESADVAAAVEIEHTALS